MKILIAGVGNVLRGDDGFGIRVAQKMQQRTVTEGVHVSEVGISGIALVHELMNGYDACIVADAVQRGGKAGTLYLLEPQPPQLSDEDAEELHRSMVDMHYAEPSKALLLASALKVRPKSVFIVACEPAEIENLSDQLTPAVERAVKEAIKMIDNLIIKLQAAAD